MYGKFFGCLFQSSRACYFIPRNNYLLKFNNRNTRKSSEVCSKLTIKTIEQRHSRRYGVFIFNFEYISHFFLVFLFLTLNKQMFSGLSTCSNNSRNNISHCFFVLVTRHKLTLGMNTQKVWTIFSLAFILTWFYWCSFKIIWCTQVKMVFLG